MPSDNSLKQIKDAFAAMTTVPHCSGSVPLDPATATIFYSRNGKAELIDFTNTTEAQLITLAETCQPATFGLDDKDILDESYRKAGKMDTTEFATHFSPLTNSIIRTVKANLVQGQVTDAEKAIRVELYKLNVYGTRRYSPQREHVWVARGCSPHRSRGRLYLAPEPEASGPGIDTTSAQRVKELQALLIDLFNDTKFLPEGGFLGFGLSHQYPFCRSSSRSLEHIANSLKGGDAEVKRVCDALGLKVMLKVVYTESNPFDQYPCCLLDKFFNFDCDQVEEDLHILKYIYDCSGSAKNPLVVYPNGMESDLRKEGLHWIRKKGRPIVWLKPSSKTNSFQRAYLLSGEGVYYGNEAMSTAYGNVCLVTKVAKAADRVA